MEKKFNAIRGEMKIKKQVLLDAANILKKEFFGIDNVIDELISYVSYWYMFPGITDRPVVVNLWGMTGVGKTSLIKRLVELIDHEDCYYRFDINDILSSRWGMNSDLDDIAKHNKGKMIIALDEFQHARTKAEDGVEVDKSKISVIWDLLDSGKYIASNFFSRADELSELYNQLSFIVKKGVEVRKGLVVKRKKLFKDKMNEEEDDDNTLLFISDCYHDSLLEILNKEFKCLFDLKVHLLTLSTHQSLEFLYKAIMIAIAPKEVDCTKALVFILGNIDEAYEMSHDFSADVSANEFYEHSLKINVSKIKKALKHRFRNEQIARLGNLHIIYPSLSEKAYQSIIKCELIKVAAKIKESTDVLLEFDKSVSDTIYQEGVYPTMGTRPVFTTIHQIVNSNIGFVFSEVAELNSDISTITLSIKDDKMVAVIWNNKEKITEFDFKIDLKLKKLRKTTNDDLQSIVAVHESGHAIIAYELLNTVPEAIHSKTSDYGLDGFVRTKFNWKYVSKKEIMARVALLLAGRAAEKLIFGDENITNGSEDDIYKATSLISNMFKECSMGEVLGAYQKHSVSTNEFLYDENDKINEEIRCFLEEAEALATKTIMAQKTLLLKISEYLINNSAMTKEKMQEYINIYHVRSNTSDRFVNKNDFYRNMVINQSKSIGEIAKDNLLESEVYMLNSKINDKKEL